MIGFALFLALLVGAGWAVVRGSRDEGDIGWARWTLGAILAGIMVHSLLYAALFEDPFVWVAAGAAVALAAIAPARRAEPAPEPAGAPRRRSRRDRRPPRALPQQHVAGPGGPRLRRLRRRDVRRAARTAG